MGLSVFVVLLTTLMTGMLKDGPERRCGAVCQRYVVMLVGSILAEHSH